MENLSINVYDKDDNIVKTCTAKATSLKFGVVRSLMNVLKVDENISTADILTQIMELWDDITEILSKCFPDMTDEDWDNVKVDELIPVLLNTLKISFAKMLTIPSDGKNQIAGQTTPR